MRIRCRARVISLVFFSYLCQPYMHLILVIALLTRGGILELGVLKELIAGVGIEGT